MTSARNAQPGGVADVDGVPETPATAIGPDDDTDAGNPIPTDGRGRKLAYDDELLNAHYIVGDGRGNENIALTAIHKAVDRLHRAVVARTIAVASRHAAGHIDAELDVRQGAA
jgi:hypothetical protein